MTSETPVKTSNIVLPSFHDFWKECRNDHFTFYICKGGRNSGKSTSISERIMFDLADMPINILCIRKVERTIRESQYEQLKEAADLLGIADLFKFDTSPLRITYLPRGNYILFRGADDPAKIKSIKTSKFPIARMWIEELAEFKTEDEIDTINASFLRAKLPEGIKYKIFYSYNPPKRKQHWLNKKYESQFIPENTYIHHSSYLDNPYLSDQTLQEIELTKKNNPYKYKWMYLGEPTGGGIVPFENLVFREISDEEIQRFDNIKQGIDWGYAADPFSFLRLHFDKMRMKLYFIDEVFGLQLSNRDVAQKIINKEYQQQWITADSAEPKSISQMKEYGISKIKGARKGEGSREFGEKWLNDLEEIVIDYNRTPGAAKEFEEIDYQVDKNGNLKSKLMEKGDNSIDAARYAMEDDMRSSKIKAGKSIF